MSGMYILLIFSMNVFENKTFLFINNKEAAEDKPFKDIFDGLLNDPEIDLTHVCSTALQDKVSMININRKTKINCHLVQIRLKIN